MVHIPESSRRTKRKPPLGVVLPLPLSRGQRGGSAIDPLLFLALRSFFLPSFPFRFLDDETDSSRSCTATTSSGLCRLPKGATPVSRSLADEWLSPPQIKLKCVGSVCLNQDGDGPAEKPCERCTAKGLPCEFVMLRRKGRPRRLPKDGAGQVEVEAEVEWQDDELEEEVEAVWEGASRASDQSPVAALVPTDPDPNLDLTTLAAGYLSDIHTFAPLLPDELPLLVYYLSTSTPVLARALSTVVYPNSPGDVDIKELGTTIADVQAAVLLVYSSYGRNHSRAEVWRTRSPEPWRGEKPRALLKWIGAHVLQHEWHLVDSPLAPYRDPVERTHIRKIFWEAWGLEALVSAMSGAPCLVLQGVAFEVNSTQNQVRHSLNFDRLSFSKRHSSPQAEGSPTNLKFRALSLLAASVGPPSASSPSLASLTSICTSLSLLSSQSYLTAPSLIERESAYIATMIASSASTPLPPSLPPSLHQTDAPSPRP